MYVLICASYLYILEDSNIIPATLSGPASGGSECGLSGEFIAGIAAAVLVLVAALAAAVWYFKSKRYRRVDIKQLDDDFIKKVPGMMSFDFAAG